MRWYRRLRLLVLGVLLVILGVVVYTRLPAPVRLDRIRLPRGFAISLYVDGLTDPRSMVLGYGGTLFVGTRSAGNVYAVRDTDGDFIADEIDTVITGLYMPNGVAFRGGALYVAEMARILRFDEIESRVDDPPRPVTVYADLPEEDWHGWRYLRFGPDGMLYVSIGAPCNICLREDDERFGTIVRMYPDGTGVEIIARGVRNSVGFDWHPGTGELWFTDNGRDWLGNENPPDELNRVAEVGQHFGFPFCHGGTIEDGDYTDRSCEEFVAPVQALAAHTAALGLRFYSGGMFPPEYRGQAFIAEHGSWNRMPPFGYRVTLVRLDWNRAVEYEVFAEGWLRRGRASGRPVDLVVLPDGSLLVSDDQAGVIYRITYEGER